MAELRAEIGHILGIDSGHRIIVIGVAIWVTPCCRILILIRSVSGSTPLLMSPPALIGTEIRGVSSTRWMSWRNMSPTITPNVAILTVPQNVAQPLADRLIGLGVRGFWNFTNVELSTKEDGVFFEDIHFVDTLLTLSYRISQL